MKDVEVIKALLLLLKDYKVYGDELPLDYNFNNNNIGVYYVINSVVDGTYKIEYSLEIHCLGLNKLNVLEDVFIIQSLLNKAQLTKDSRIIRKNVFRNYIKDNGKHHFILEFYVVNMEG